MAKQAFLKKQNLLNKNLNQRNHLDYTYGLYGSQAWTLKVYERKRLDTFEIWIWRKMSKARWIEKSKERLLQDVEAMHHQNNKLNFFMTPANILGGSRFCGRGRIP